MNFKAYEQGKQYLLNDDNKRWLDKIECWIKEEKKYNIYVFSVVIKDTEELQEYYNAISSAIAIEFQTTLEKQIEKWNIYLVFQCTSKIDIEIKDKVEQDKYSTRKMVWDNLEEGEINKLTYLDDRLFNLRISEEIYNHSDQTIRLADLIKKYDEELYADIAANKVEKKQKM